MANENRLTLVVMPFAGSGASVFNEWNQLNNNIDVVAIQLPGREKRFIETPYTDVKTAVDLELQQVLDAIDPNQPIAIFGHSLGAVLAYEMVHLLVKQPGLDVRSLYVSGSPGPRTQRTKRATGLNDDDFVKCVEEFAGYSHVALKDPNMRELLLPLLRADVEMHENYKPSRDIKLNIPIYTLRGDQDTLVSAEMADQWKDATTAPKHCIEFSGGHMYLVEQAAEMLQEIEKTFFKTPSNINTVEYSL
ncbi:thioesterase II family protein [Rheinheimera oceanensis]|uniref:thioesterase II family protein n=1 Tax=Rheinheimera oceanensis TaxID=2817449 RepID=UPI001BFE003D|nr:alpha/beta fold hydrolase [Rheinheimera oceanensis]